MIYLSHALDYEAILQFIVKIPDICLGKLVFLYVSRQMQAILLPIPLYFLKAHYLKHVYTCICVRVGVCMIMYRSAGIHLALSNNCVIVLWPEREQNATNRCDLKVPFPLHYCDAVGDFSYKLVHFIDEIILTFVVRNRRIKKDQICWR